MACLRSTVVLAPLRGGDAKLMFERAGEGADIGKTDHQRHGCQGDAGIFQVPASHVESLSVQENLIRQVLAFQTALQCAFVAVEVARHVFHGSAAGGE